MSAEMYDLIEKHCIWLFAKGREKKTVSGVRQILAEFCDYISAVQKKNDVRQISKEDIDAYIDWLDSRISQKTGDALTTGVKNKRISVIRIFFEFLALTERVMLSPAQSAVLKKEGLRLPRDVMTDDEIKSLFLSIKQNTPTGKRNYVMFRFLYHTGLRRSELTGLRVQDIDFESGIIFVKGKGRKTRIVPLGANIARILNDYLRKIRPELLRQNPREERVFITAQGREFSKNAIAALVKYYRQKAGIAKEITTHSFRHTFATHLLNMGASIRHIQQVLGHEYLDTTEIYARVSIKNLREMYEKTHPRAIKSPENILKNLKKYS